MPQERKQRRSYTDEEKGRALATLEINGGNVKGTARALGIPWETIRTWKGQQEKIQRNPQAVLPNINTRVMEFKEKSLGGYLDQAELVRDQALEKLKSLIPQATATNIAAITNLVVALSDRIDRAKGIADRHTVVEHKHQVGPSDEVVQALLEYVASTREDAIERSQEIIDADVVEQPEYLGLPAAEGDEEDG